jgi:hypothetical protein
MSLPIAQICRTIAARNHPDEKAMTLPFDDSPWKDDRNWLVTVAILGHSDDPDNVECLD